MARRAAPAQGIHSFYRAQTNIVLRPNVAYPWPDQPFALIIDTATSVTKVNSKVERTFRQVGGLGAILCQPDHSGKLHVVAYASRVLMDH